jgi:choline-sulfatase
VTAEHVRRARHAYFGMVSYVDEKIGRVLAALEETGLADDTLVVFAGDHGEMLGERGMWFKQCFFEWSVRVPLMVSLPRRFAPARVAAHVSLVDLLPTFMELALGGAPFEPVDPIDGASLMPLLARREDGADRIVVSEYSSEGVCAASRMVRSGHHKYIFTRGLPPMLFDLRADPDELVNLAGRPDLASLQARLHARAVQRWDPDEMHERILASQRRRLFIDAVHGSSPRYSNWAFQPFTDESKRFIRGSGSAGPTSVKARARFPFVAPVAPDRGPNHPPANPDTPGEDS